MCDIDNYNSLWFSTLFICITEFAWGVGGGGGASGAFRAVLGVCRDAEASTIDAGNATSDAGDPPSYSGDAPRDASRDARDATKNAPGDAGSDTRDAQTMQTRAWLGYP